MAVMAPYTNNQQFAAKYRQSQAQTASPTQLVVMLYDGAVRFLSLAREKMATGELEQRHIYLLKAQRILGELLASLDREKGGEVAENLSRIYLYMIQQLMEANMQDKAEPVNEVIELLLELRESWAQVDLLQKQTTGSEAVTLG